MKGFVEISFKVFLVMVLTLIIGLILPGSEIENQQALGFSTESLNHIFTYLLESLKLGLLALFWVLFLSFGFIFAYFRFQSLSWVIEGLITLIQSTPIFLIALSLIYIFAIKFEIFPMALWESPLHMVLPSFILGLKPASSFVQILSQEIKNTSRENFVRTAIGKGLGGWALWWPHILKPSLSGGVIYLGQSLAGLLTGSVLIEYLFSIPGSGRLFIQSIQERDIGSVVVLVGIYSLILQLAVIVSLKVSESIDPRIKAQSF